jgi:hypothetical protein
MKIARKIMRYFLLFQSIPQPHVFMHVLWHESVIKLQFVLETFSWTYKWNIIIKIFSLFTWIKFQFFQLDLKLERVRATFVYESMPETFFSDIFGEFTANKWFYQKNSFEFSHSPVSKKYLYLKFFLIALLKLFFIHRGKKRALTSFFASFNPLKSPLNFSIFS